jgi:hypothetical protein
VHNFSISLPTLLQRGIVLLTSFCLLPHATAQDDFTTWFTPTTRSYSFLDLQAGASDQAGTDIPNEDAQWGQVKLNGLTTVYTGANSDVAVWAGHQDTDATLSSGTEVPDAMRATRLGVTARWVETRWLAGLSVLGQDNGDQGAFDNEQGVDITGFASYRAENGWGVWGFLQYEGLVQDTLLLSGGISYHDEQWEVLLGLPWSKVRWQPIDSFGVQAIYYGGPWYADATWFFHDRWRLGLGVQERVDGFFRADRSNDEDQFQIRQRQMRPYVLSGHMPDLGKRIFGD